MCFAYLINLFILFIYFLFFSIFFVESKKIVNANLVKSCNKSIFL
jgi:hypothetical protein